MTDTLQIITHDRLAFPEQLERRQTPRKRLTIEVSTDLHRRMLMICSTRGKPVNEAVREVLERAFPA